MLTTSSALSSAVQRQPSFLKKSVQMWCDDNQMRLNISKCKVIHFKPKIETPLPAITLKNTTLMVVLAYKYLGSELTPTVQPNETESPCSSTQTYVCSNNCGIMVYDCSNSLLRIIGISRESALKLFNIKDVRDFLAGCSTTQVACIIIYNK